MEVKQRQSRRQKESFPSAMDATGRWWFSPEENVAIDDAIQQFRAWVRTNRSDLSWGLTLVCTIVVRSDGPCVAPNLASIWPEFERQAAERGWLLNDFDPATGTFDVVVPGRVRVDGLTPRPATEKEVPDPPARRVGKKARGKPAKE